MIRVVRLVALVALLFLASATAARAEDPLFVGWTALAPALTTEYEPSSENDCAAGRTRCVDAVIREMYRRLRPLASSCDHDSIFSLTYLRTTEEYRRAIADPAFFQDTRFVDHEDVVFARYYFEAYDDWAAGRRAAVPQAWAIAFRAAGQRAVSAAGNVALGINAHVQRDLPFVLAAIGMVKPDGSSRKADHDKVNVFLNRVADDLYPEIARRFDPTIDDSELPGTADNFAAFQIIPTWREIAWRNAERLVSAPSAEARARVAAEIEAYAASQAQTLRTAYQYGPLSSSAARDAYCAAHHDDP
jgi:uncharacterized protein DUF5995